MLYVDKTNRIVSGKASEFKQLLKFASKDASRVALDKIWVDFDAQAMFATDRYRLVVVGEHTSPIEPKRCVPISADIVRALPKDAELRLADKTWHQKHLASWPVTASANPPPVEQVIPKPCDKPHSEVFGLNPMYLSDVGVFGKMTGAKYVSVHLGASPLDPILLSVVGAKMVLMPCRI